MESQRIAGAVCALLLVAQAPHARAADRDFSLTIAPYAWLIGMSGTIGVKGEKTTIDESFTDLLDQTDTLFGLFGRVEGHLLPFGFYVDGGYTKLGINNVHGSEDLGDVDVSQEMGIIDFGLMYRLLDLSKGADKAESRFSLDATVGGRYWTMSLELDPEMGPTESGGQAWIDPTVGLRGTIDIGHHLEIVLGGDVGGFGAASQFTWSAVGTIGYAFHIGSVESSVFAGYKAIGDDYSNGGFTWDVVLSGPIIGMSFTF